MKDLSQTTKYAIGIIIFFVVSVVIMGLMFFRLNAEGQELESQMEVVGKSKLLQERHNSVLALVKKFEDEHQVLANHLLTESETINFLTEIESQAEKMNITLKTNSLTVAPLPDTAFQKIDLDLNLRGKQQALIRYLNLLETLPYYSRITDLDIRAGQGAGDTSWIATVTVMLGLQEEHD